jgi:transcriptional regulator with XRE-family HTH domain
MIGFERDFLENFLATIRKYMQLRGSLSQKELAEKINVGVSTISRFLNQKTKDIDEQLVAKVVAYLNIPLHEMIDFIQEQHTDKFKSLVKFYREEQLKADGIEIPDDGTLGESATGVSGAASSGAGAATRTVTAGIGKKKRTLSFIPESDDEVLQRGSADDQSMREKFQRLSPRQKAYLSDFLDLDAEARDLIVDIGNSLLRYFKQKNMEF